MGLTVLNVAYPLAPVGPDAVGGAEQILSQLDRGLVQAGHQSIVVACRDSSVAGVLVPTPQWPGGLDEVTRRAAWEHCRSAIGRALSEWPVQVMHLHGIDFMNYLPSAGPPALVTLHLPPEWYPPQVFSLARPSTWLNCVSASQSSRCPAGDLLLPEIENGVALNSEAPRCRSRTYALSLGRICPEKGFHLALNAAVQAQIPFVLAGKVFSYREHEEYFRHEIEPRLDRQRRFIGPAGGARKQRLLASARCLLAPSLVPETSSLVALEALAAGTPVVAFPAGALADIIEPGKTGFFVENEKQMAEAIHLCAGLSSENCREAALRRFSLAQMLEKYFAVYHLLADGAQRENQGAGCSAVAK